MKVSIFLLAISAVCEYRFAFYSDQKAIKADKEIPKPTAPRKAAIAMIPDASNPLSKGVIGFVELFQKDKSSPIQITGQISGLPPNSEHGLHFHENGNIFPNCTATGGHFNPKSAEHGAPTDKVHHVGDLGNVKSDQNGVISLKLQFDFITLYGGYSIFARSLVLHEKVDDLGHGVGDLAKTSKVTGNSGTRLSCGVVGRVD